MSRQLPTPATLEWSADSQPSSADYGDVYFSRADGLQETRHVFLDGNQFSQRLIVHKEPWFTIGETGFGTGLNILAAWQAWDAAAEPKPNLHIVTLDLHPLAPEALARAHTAWPELEEYAAQLQACYPPLWPGMHRRYLAEDRICIDFLWGEASEMLASYQPAFHAQKVDAWFLDGFSPAKNPAMWQTSLYQQIARLSHAGTTLATFTSAGHVRRGLQEAGFSIRKVAGYAHKREMTVGEFQSISAPVLMKEQEAIIIGAGIAGIGAAWQLVRAGRHVRLIDSASAICTGASANPVSAFTPYFTADWSQRGRIYASAFTHSAHLQNYLKARGHRIMGSQCGSLMLDDPDSPRARQQERHGRLNFPPETLRAVNAEEASMIAGITLQHGGHFYPAGGWLCMRDLCDALVAEMGDKLTFEPNQRISSIRHENGQWHAQSETGHWQSDTLVVACGHHAAALLPELGLQPVRGQLLQIPAASLPALDGLRTTLHFGEYLLPSVNGAYILGSSFGNGDADTDIRLQESDALLANLVRIFPQIDAKLILPTTTAWVGIRAATRQRQPLIGPAKNQPAGLYLSLGHGSRGTLSGVFPFATEDF